MPKVKIKKVLIDDSKFKFENPKDTFRGFFIEEKGDELIFEDEDGNEFSLPVIPAVVRALDMLINGKAIREHDDLLLKIEFLGNRKVGDKTEEYYRVSVE